MNSNPIPKSIVRAICKIQSCIDAVPKTQRNAHAGFMFSSTDDIYAAIARKMGDVGLACFALERECDIKRLDKKDKDGKEITVQWLHATYQFILATDEDSWTNDDFKRSVYTQVTGPQSFQAAQSYCEKSFYRSLFRLPSGDQDLDSMPQAETEEAQAALNGNGGKRKSSASAKRDGTDKTYNEIIKAIKDAPNAEVLQQIPELYCDDIASLPKQWNELYEHTYEDRMDEFRAVRS